MRKIGCAFLVLWLFLMGHAFGQVTVNVTSYGAKCDGSTDDSTAFSNAMSAVNANGGILIIPPGTCVVNSTSLAISHTGVVIEGAGRNATTLTTNSATLVQVSSSVADSTVQDLKLTRSVTATSGGDGIDMCLSSACNTPVIKNLLVQNAYEGMQLGPAAYGLVERSVLQNNQDDGVLLTGLASSNGLQWTLRNILSQANNNNGFAAVANSSGGNGTLAPWQQVYTFANKGAGVLISGVSSSAALNDGQITGGFFGSDCSHEIELDSYGGYFVISNNMFEYTGQEPCGVNLGSSKSNVGASIYITSHGNQDVNITGNHMITASYSCIIDNSQYTSVVSSNTILACGQANVSGNNNGIVSNPSAAATRVYSDNLIYNNPGYGILLEGSVGTTGYLTGDVCTGNTLGAHGTGTGSTAHVTGGSC